MISFDHEVWGEFTVNAKARDELLRCLSRLYQNVDDKEMWEQLYDDLHHQGDVTQLSYAAVPHVLEIERTAPKFNYYGFHLIALIEHCRPTNEQPRPGEIADAYKKAWSELLTVVAKDSQQKWDDKLTSSILTCIAFARGQRFIAWAILEFTEQKAKDWILAENFVTDEDLAVYNRSLPIPSGDD